MLKQFKKALVSIQRHGLAAAIFAPGWTFEFLGPENFWENEKLFWVGDPYRPITTSYGPIAKYTNLNPCGGTDFFYSNFSRGFGKEWRVRGEVGFS